MSKDLHIKYLKDLFNPCDIPGIPSPGWDKAYNSYMAADRDHKRFTLLYNKKTIEQCLLLYQEIKKSTNLFFQRFTSKNKKLLLELKILIRKLFLWERYLSERGLISHLNPKEIILRNLSEGPAFAESLKKTYDYSLRVVTGINFTPPYGVEIFKFTDINQIFPSNHLIDFRKENPDLSDIEWSFKKAPDTIKGKDALYTLMVNNIKSSENLRMFDDLDSVRLGSGKKSFNPSKLRTEPSITLREAKGFPKDTRDGLIFKISSAHKAPDEDRVIAVADIESRNLIYMIREYTSLILNAKYDFYGCRPWQVEKKLHECPGREFIMYDQKKCGWQFPTELVTLAFKAMLYHYPDNEYLKSIHRIFETKNIHYWFQGQHRTPSRGFILGMFDNVVSFIMACIFELWLETIHEDHRKYIDGAFYGDDSIIINNNTFDNPHTTAQLRDHWVKYTYEKYGIIPSIKKTYIAKVGVFCEIYGNYKSVCLTKVVKYILLPYNAMKCINTVHAKDYINGIQHPLTQLIFWLPKTLDAELIRRMINISYAEVISSFQYEFGREEVTIPYELGGWFSEKSDQGNTLIMKLYQHNFGEAWLRVGYTDKKQRFINLNKLKDQFLKNPWYMEFLDTLDIDLGEGNIKDTILRSLASYKVEKFKDPWVPYYFKLEKARKKAFSKPNRNLGLNHYIDFMVRHGNEKYHIDPSICYRRDPSMTYVYSFRIPHEKRAILKVEPIRALSLMCEKANDKNFLTTKYSNDISVGELALCLHRFVCKHKYLIPISWLRWCLRNKISADELWKSYKVEYNINIFEFEPPPITFGEKYLEFIGVESKHTLIYWDKNLKRPIPITEEQAIMLEQYIGSETLVCQILGIDFVFYQKLKLIHSLPVKKKQEEEELDEEEREFLRQANLPPAPPEPKIEIKIENYIVDLDLDAPADPDVSEEAEDHWSSGSDDNDHLPINQYDNIDDEMFANYLDQFSDDNEHSSSTET